ADIEGLRTEVKADIEGLRTAVKADIEGLRTAVKAGIEGLRTEMKAHVVGFGGEVRASEERLAAGGQLQFAQLTALYRSLRDELQRLRKDHGDRLDANR